MQQFKSTHQHLYKKIIIDKYDRDVPQDKRIFSVRTDHIFKHLSVLRNYILSRVNTDYLLSLDSDILVPDNILNRLLSHNKDIVSGLIYNGYVENVVHPYMSTNLMKYDFYGRLNHVSNYKTKNARFRDESELIEVDVTGAIILLSKAVCKSVKYDWHFQGEDIAFCNHAKEKGFKIYSDLSAWCTHVMSKN